jgi:TIM-barrel protein
MDFEPRVALASLSGEADAEWARRGAPHAGLAVLGGIALDETAREAAREMVRDRDRTEFLPADPLGFVDAQLTAIDDAPIRAAVNVRSATGGPITDAAAVCAAHDAACEVNAHCRQAELCAVGCGESLLRETDRLAAYVERAAGTGATVGVKVRAEVPGVDLVAVASAVEAAGADYVHVDAMDSEAVVGEVVEATDLFVVANNGVRDRETAWEYLGYGADAVSVGRPSDDSAVLSRVRAAVEAWSGRRRGVEP